MRTLPYFLFITVQHLRQRFHGSGLTRAAGTQQQKHPYRAAIGRQARLIKAHVRSHRIDRFRLPDNVCRQRGLQLIQSLGGGSPAHSWFQQIAHCPDVSLPTSTLAAGFRVCTTQNRLTAAARPPAMHRL